MLSEACNFDKINERIELIMKKDGLRVVPVKNYVILFGVMIGSFLLLYYFYKWFDTYEESKLNMRILDSYMQVINHNEIDDYVTENPDTVIYVSILQDKEIREFEKLVKQKYRDKLIEKEILYLDMTNVSEKDMVMLKNKYYYNNLSIGDMPCLLVFNDGIVNAIYSVESNNYNIDSFLMYVNQINYEMDDLDD